MIYFDNAATTLKKPKEVVDEMVVALSSYGNPSRGGHGYSIAGGKKIYEVRVRLSKLFNIEDPLNIAFTKNSTESLNIAIKGYPLEDKDEIITTVQEHNSVLRPIYKRIEDEKKNGKEIRLKIVGIDEKGNLDYGELESLITKKTKLLVINHGSNLTGNIIDLERIDKIRKKSEVKIILDASQTAGVVPVDIGKTKVDILCFTGHKGLYGPSGTGGIYVDPKIDLPSCIVGGSGSNSFSKTQPQEMPDKLEGGTPNFHGIAGLNGGLKFIEKVGLENIYRKENELMSKFYRGISNLDKVKVYGDFSKKERAPIVTFNIEGLDSSSVAEELWEEYGIAVRPGIHCTPLLHKSLKSDENGSVRFSFSYHNTLKEVEKGIEAIKKIVEAI